VDLKSSMLGFASNSLS